MKPRKPSKSIFSRNSKTSKPNASDNSSAHHTGPDKSKKGSSIFVSKPLYGKRTKNAAENSEPVSTSVQDSPETKQRPPMDEAQRDHLIRLFIKRRKSWILGDDNRSDDETFELLKTGKFKSASDEDIYQQLDHVTRWKNIARYVWIKSDDATRNRPDYKDHQMGEIEKLEAGKFGKMSNDQVATHVDKINEKFLADHKRQASKKKGSRTGFLASLKKRFSGSSSKVVRPQASTATTGQSTLAEALPPRPLTRTARLAQIYEELYNMPADEFIRR